MKTRQNIKAIIYDKRGNILSIGENSYTKSHPMQAKYANAIARVDEEFNARKDYNKIYLHAEIHAIVRCKDLTRAHKIVIVRTDVKGNVQLAKPCKICEQAIIDCGIKVVEWS